MKHKKFVLAVCMALTFAVMTSGCMSGSAEIAGWGKRNKGEGSLKMSLDPDTKIKSYELEGSPEFVREILKSFDPPANPRTPIADPPKKKKGWFGK